MNNTDIINFLNSDIEVLDISVRSYNCLKRSNIRTVGDLLSLDIEELKEVRHLTVKCYKEIISKTKAAIERYPELEFGMKNLKSDRFPIQVKKDLVSNSKTEYESQLVDSLSNLDSLTTSQKCELYNLLLARRMDLQKKMQYTDVGLSAIRESILKNAHSKKKVIN